MSNDAEYGILSLEENLSDYVSNTTDTENEQSKESHSFDADSDTDTVEEEIDSLEETLQTRIKERITSLQMTLFALKDQIKSETELWKKEVDETVALQKKQEKTMNDYCYEYNLSCKEYYDRQSLMYQEVILRAQAAKKAKMQREIAITSYKTQLLQVENMCNLELTRVNQVKQNLQPLQMIASEWNRGDYSRDQNAEHNEQLDAKLKSPNSSTIIKESVNELYSNMNEMFNEIANKFASAATDLKRNEIANHLISVSADLKINEN